MGVVLEAIKSVWPRGRLKPNDAILGGIADAVTDLRASGRAVIDEAWPGTATDTLRAWHDTLGVKYDGSVAIDDQRIRLEAVATAVGGSSIGLLEAQIQKEFPGVFVVETSFSSEAGEDECGVAECGDTEGVLDPNTYTLTGEIPDDSSSYRIQAILARYAPAHMDPVSDLEVLSLSESSEAGEDVCGAAVAEGYDSGDLVAPSFSVNPYLAGTAEIGTVLYVYPGVVEGVETPTLTYQWRKDGVDILGETDPGLLIPSIGTYTCAVRASNSSGFATYVPTGILSPSTVPVLTWDGSFSVNDELVFVFPSFVTYRTRTPQGVSATGNPDPNLTFQWYKNGVPVTTYISLGDYAGTVADYELVVTATNIAGSDSVSSGVFNPW